jgi:FAD:protein FMN transferase
MLACPNILRGALWLTTILWLGSCNSSPRRAPAPETSVRIVAPEQAKSSTETKVIERSTTAMKTLFTIRVTDSVEREMGRRAVEAAFAEIRRVEALMTSWDPKSVLSEVSANAGIRPVTAPTELLDIIEESNRVSALSEGKFNILTQSLMGLYNHRANPPRVPDPDEIARRLPLLDLRSLVMDRQKGTLYLAKSGMQIGLGAIAKGYGVDRAAQVLKANGIKDFIVDGGGNLFVSGKKGQSSWNVAVRDPRAEGHSFASLDVNGETGISTSGDYEKSFIVGNRRYHHILDPSTGYPAEGIVSATVIHKTAERADALSTAVFVMGLKEGMRLIEADPDAEAILVDDALQMYLSSGLKGRVQLSPLGTSQPPAERRVPNNAP